MTCSAAECPNPARKGGLCWAHLKRRAKGQSLTEPVQVRGDKRLRLVEAALSLVDVNSEDDREWRNALDRLCDAAVSYANKKQGA